MKYPRQWINIWLKEDSKRHDLVECFCARYHNLREKGDIPFTNNVWLLSRPELKVFKEIHSVNCSYGILPKS